ncbi:MAG: hypothetical protein KDH96_01800 [Candidatus Riesia sp.]|nr:hypothetical protein [Candidatus Riesia sp.]
MKKKIGKYTLEGYEVKGFEDTVKEIIRFSKLYFKDLLEPNKQNKDIKLMSNRQFFEFIKSLPYVKDFKEFLNRPSISLLMAENNHPFDCDDRTILSLAFFRLKNYLLGYERFKTRVLVTGRYNKPHHVYIEFKDGAGNWTPFDPTYPRNIYGEHLFEPNFKKVFEA